MDSKDGSPYIANFDLVPPSPPSRSQHQLELDPDSPFNVNNHQYDHHDPLTSPPFLDSVPNFDNIDIDIVDDDNIHNSSNSHLGSGHNSPNIQHLHQQHHNQSYNSSYYNSPYSQTSELSFTGEELNFELLSDMVGGIGSESNRRFNDGDDGNEAREYEEYNPSDYDGQSTSSVSATSPPPMGGLMSGTMGMGEVPTSSLLMYAHADADYVSPHFSPDAMDRRQGQGQGHSLTHQHLQQQQLQQQQQQQQHRSRNSPFDHSSPSSNGDPGDNNNSFASATDQTATRHSRASSTHSVHHGYNNVQQLQQQQQHLSASPQPPSSPQPGYLNHQNQNVQSHPSPRTFDVARSLGNMSVHTPNWGTQPLPSLSVSQAHSPNLRHNGNLPLPQMQQQQQQQQGMGMGVKPQSPPRLQMPEDMQFNGGRQQQQGGDANASSLSNSLLMAGVPKINAPDDDMGEQHNQNGNGDGVGNGNGNDNNNNDGLNTTGPRFHIVPATPISGGGVDGVTGAPFQQTLATLTQGSELGFGLQHPQQQQQQRNPSPARSSAPPSNSVSPSPSPAPSPDPERETFHQQQQGTHSRHASTSPFVGSVALPGSAPNSAGLNTTSSTGANTASSTGEFVFPDMSAMTPAPPPPSNNNSAGLGVFGHVPGRGRSNSDTWGQYEYQQQQAQLQRVQAAQAAAQLQRQQQQHAQAAQTMHTFSFGGNNNNANENGNFLSPDNGNGGLRRSISISSDTLGAPSRGHRVSRSEDVRLPMMGAGFGPQQQLGMGQGQQQDQQQQYIQNQQQQYQTHHPQSNSMGGGLYLDYQQQQQQQQQFLHPLHVPNMSLGGSGGSVSGGSTGGGPGSTGGGSRRSLSPGLGGSGGSNTSFTVGHFRRASSGSRSDRGAEVWGSQAVGGNMSGHGHSASIGTLGVPRRVNPYPSPNASPRVRYGELEEDDGSGIGLGLGMGGMSHGLGLPSSGNGMGLGMSIGISSSGMAGGLQEIGEPPVSAGYSEEVAITGRGTYMNDGASSQGGRRRAESSTSIGADAASAVAAAGAIAKQNVTTGRTANASIRRRKQDANFACTVPGCNSTFTRGFNLKGHLRSHFEQKPYKCHWPGCGKGFARQHDCKRHEQLHSNYRPFECDGCRKQFARMDALNRHLRSEAGAECAKIVEKSKENGGVGGASGSRDVGMEYDDPSSGDDGDEEKPPLPMVTTRSGRIVPRRRQTGAMDEDRWAGVAL